MDSSKFSDFPTNSRQRHPSGVYVVSIGIVLPQGLSSLATRAIDGMASQVDLTRRACNGSTSCTLYCKLLYLSMTAITLPIQRTIVTCGSKIQYAGDD